MADLRVELYGHHLGTLTGTDWRTFDFTVDRSAFTVFELGSSILSESIPLEMVSKRHLAGRRRNFFAELLPEGDILQNLAAEASVEPYDTIGLLSRFGRDVAGALQIWDPERPGEPRVPSVTPLTDRAVAALLADPVNRPLANDRLTGKTSLGGVQQKIVLAAVDGEWNQANDGYPSTHILKPRAERHPTMIYDEEYGARLARKIDVAEHETSLQTFAGTDALVIERYDRSTTSPDSRIHQEDMNQVLGARGIQKYQEYGGAVSLARIAGVLRENADGRSVVQFLRMVTLSVAIGNLDMHAKNISLLHPFDGRTTLAPAYDTVPQTHHDNDGRMALAVNRTYQHAALTARDIVEEAESWGMRNAADVVAKTLEAVDSLVETETPDARAHQDLAKDIRGFTRRLLNGRAAGNPTGRL